MTEAIWEPDPAGVLWRSSGHGFMEKSIRNDDLWARRTEVRLRNRLRALEWRDAAVLDGWVLSPTYDHESTDSAWRLSRDGFSVQGLSRLGGDKGLPCASIHIWGPDGLQVRPPPVYDWAAIVAGSRRCTPCGAQDVDTQRYSFAGRCCAACVGAMRAAHERPGWCD